MIDGREMGVTRQMVEQGWERVEGKGGIIEELLAILPGDEAVRLR